MLTNTHINELITLCKINNQQAQVEVYNRYVKAMYNTAYRIVNDSYKAEDVMQESFLTAFKKLDSLNDTATFGAWLKRIVINNSIQLYNANAKTNNISLDTIINKVEDEQGVDIENTSKNKQVKDVLHALNTLKPNYKLALNLHLIEGYDYEEISSIMDISYANCRTIVSRAKESLRKKLTKHTIK